jgi:exoribonuclease R
MNSYKKLTKEEIEQKQKSVLTHLQDLEDKWWKFLQANKKLAELVLIDPDGVDAEKHKSIPLDVQLWDQKRHALFNLIEALKVMNGTISEELYYHALGLGNDFWLEIKDHDPQNLSIFK